jgi:hypothetical protein
MADAVVRAVLCTPTGLATDTRYEFIGGDITSSPPAGS